jgi:methyl-accepting chemotaxis protein WspA
MRNLTIWQRLNLTMGVLILLLLIGGGLAIWMERANRTSDATTAELDAQREQILGRLEYLASVCRITAANPAIIEAERKLVRDKLADPQVRIDANASVTGQARTQLIAALKRTEALADAFIAFHTSLLTINQANPDQLSAFYSTNYSKLLQELGEVRKELESAYAKAGDLQVEKAAKIWWTALAGIIAAMIAAIVVGRVQSRSVTAPMATIVAALERMQQGDFTGRVQMERRDEFGAVSKDLNKLADELTVLVGQVQRSGIQVNSTATEIAATAKEQQSTVNEIAATTAEIGATSKEISATSKELVKTMNEVTAVSEETAELAGSGQSAIGKMESTMRQIMEASSSITSKLAVLNEKTANINTVVTTITKVADQTNLLSLNAAIEAEKAGEYGLGFAVVAMEIRRLADQTAVATYDIEKMVKEMQSAVAAGVMGMDKFSEEVRRGVDEVRQVGGQLAQIIHQVQTLTPRFHTVNEGMNAQATGAQQISETLTQLNEAAQLTAESLRQSNAAIEQLNEAARGLQAGVARFKLKAN